ncbi:hypothetical protein CEP54_012057 [Fusarium duplospermum]|uniref:C2H2-type domain-containing protein n=1 Tax=Fusarium duplospermum TaxID=1325734 RepID=A0A428PB34_9HYPO|nr:hypothetical protein CEP54_012057 [Fusarium duplospermum]
MFISELSHECEQALADACAEALSKTDIHDELEDNQGATQDHSLTNKEQLLTAIKTEQGRFRVWARNIGALQDPTSSSSNSLLHNATKVQKPVICILEGLLASLSRARKILSGELPNRTAAIEATDEGVSQAKEKEMVSTKETTYNEAEDESSVSLREVLDNSGRSTRTNATSFVTILNDGSAEVGVPDLERLKFKNIWLKYNEFIECPFCRTIQRHHVFADLQPYVCTFEDCSSGMFKARHDWFRHEMDCHRREWHCLKCRNVFGSQSDLGLHFKTNHAGDIAESQIEQLLKMCGRPIRHFGYGSCPLCDTWQPARDDGDNSQDFCKHLAHHLQQLALSAISLGIDGLEIEGGDADEEIESDQLPALSESDFIGLEEFCIFRLYEPSQYSSPQRNAFSFEVKMPIIRIARISPVANATIQLLKPRELATSAKLYRNGEMQISWILSTLGLLFVFAAGVALTREV